ncbi:MAG TPA: tRNA (adenosine(37)-N6)-dimethylallyltransferase MiaA [Pirellulales bacterium]|nr:tRNA (adenosine(37)-N6)-dimethylallyltransferase MiaA [Pirellulales bacterium]
MTVEPVSAPAWYLTGPTAAGKTGLALELAERLGAEIVSMDSMAVYRGLDIGTAKPTARDRERVPHWLVDLIEPDEEFSVAQYVAAAERTAAYLRSRGREVLFVGGTPLYLKALLRGIFEGPPADWELRHHLLAECERKGNDWLYRKLTDVDPVAAQRLHPHDTRRLIRALEVFEKTGRPISSWQQQFERARPAEECRVFVLDWPRDELYARIDRRVEEMFGAGIIGEVSGLLSRGKRLGRTAHQALGYREVLEHLAGERNLADTIGLVQTRTRQFAKRQLTWFRSLSECRWVPMSPESGPAAIAATVARLGAAAVQDTR